MPSNNIKKILIVILCLFHTGIAFAVTSEDIPIPTQINGLDEQIDVTVTPEYPKPGDKVSVKLEAYGIDLNNTQINWIVDGQPIKNGVGETTFETYAKGDGIQTNIQVKINPVLSNPIEKIITIKPQTVDLLWEAKTYIPPFYKGKAMFTPQEKVVFVAIPNVLGTNGYIANPKLFTYKWSKQDEVLGSLSGFGKDSLTYIGDILMRPIETRVEVSGSNNTNASNYLNLVTQSPETYIYENNALYGTLFNKEISNQFDFGDAEERTVSAYPYFMGISNRMSNLVSYNWQINYNTINVPPDQSQMTFRNTEQKEGKSIINIKTKNTKNLFQESETSTYINFTKPKTVFSFN